MSAAPHVEAPPASEARALRVLLVEDNPDDAFIIEDLLGEAEGLEPFERVELRRADSLEGALQALRDEVPDLILTDLDLPDSRGYESFTRVRAAAPDVPVVIVTGLEDDEIALQAVRNGAQDYLVKGVVDGDALTRSIRYALARFERRDAHQQRGQERYQAALAGSDTPTLVVDAGGDVLYANPAARTSLGGAPLRVALDPEQASLEAELEGGLSAGVNVRAVTDTLWEGRLSRLVSLERAREDESAISAALRQRAESPALSRFEGMVSASPAMAQLFKTIARVAPTPANVLLLGETGTGKELVARALHRRSGRSGRFVAIDCGAVPEGLIESELFGHERGAFTGASARKMGLFRHAEKGTLLLDEVGNLPLGAQNSLLRTLQEGTVRPVGSQTELQVDVRVVAATSEPLWEAVQAGRFREDLFYRLDVLRIELLPLRERPEDVLHLFHLFGRDLAERYELDPPEVGRGFLEAMLEYDWPGNVRQLENFTERLFLALAPCASRRDFHEFVRPYRPTRPGTPGVSGGSERREPEPSTQVDLALSLTQFMDQQERAYLEALLRETSGGVQAAAARAGVNRRTILRKLRQHQIDKTEFM